MPAESNVNNAPPVIHVISDSVGDSAATIALAAASQFVRNCVIERLPRAKDIIQIEAFIDAHLERNNGEEIVVFYTIADPHLRSDMTRLAGRKNIAAVDLIGPAIDAIAEATGMKPQGKPGLIRRTDREYFNRVSAMEFAVDHDDGRNTEELAKSDIVIIGSSRTSKTPLSIYLAMQGYRVANVPLAPGVEPPAELFEVEQGRIFGLMSKPEILADIRHRRLGNAIEVAGEYADPSFVQEDLDESRALMRRLGCIVVRTDNRAIEETAQEILRYYHLSFPQGS
jgi:regulator of PEP synthase PpsR (kinase-PPPase family)